jgi:DNA excision repair protein ERCC-1
LAFVVSLYGKVKLFNSTMQSLADIAASSSDKMQLLPGLGRVKVRRIKDAFERQFYPRSVTTEVADKASGTSDHPQATRENSRRDPSPVWDMELDLTPFDIQSANDPNEEARISIRSQKSTIKLPTREPTPIWDIELDLNKSDDESVSESDGPAKKRKK